MRNVLEFAGGDPVRLRRSAQEAHTVRALGGLVLTTASIAAVATAVVAHDWLGLPWVVAALVATAGGTAMMALNRVLLTAARTEERTWRAVVRVVPGLLLIVAIGVVLAQALGLQVFAPEITLQAQRERSSKLLARELRLDRRLAKISALAAKRAELRHENHRLAATQRAARCEVEGICGSRVRGCGPACLVKQQQAVLRIRGKRSATALPQVSAQLSAFHADRGRLVAAIAREASAPLGASDRLAAFQHLADRVPSVAWAQRLLTLWLAALLVAPPAAGILARPASRARPDLWHDLRDHAARN